VESMKSAVQGHLLTAWW